MDQPGNFRQLLSKYSANEASEQEIRELFAFIAEPANHQVVNEALAEELEEVKAGTDYDPQCWKPVIEKILATRPEPARIYHLPSRKKKTAWIRYVAAAIFIGVAVLTIYIINDKTGNDQPPATAEIDENVLYNYVLNASAITQEKAVAGLDSLLSCTAKDSIVFRQTVSFLLQPLSNPNSVYRNEALCIRLLQCALQSRWYNKAEKASMQIKLQLVMQNRVGNAANNFKYVTLEGSNKEMYSIQASYLLLYFYNPECLACKEMKAALQQSVLIESKIKNGELKLLAVYTDKDQATWRKHLPAMPLTWLHGRDEDEYLYKNNIYDLRAIPTLYLLDKDKKVLLKDCISLPAIEQQLADSPNISGVKE